MPDFGHCGDDLSGHANPFAGVVSRHVVVDHPKERGQRLGAAKSVGAETIQDRLDDAASIASRHGKTGTGFADGPSRSG